MQSSICYDYAIVVFLKRQSTQYCTIHHKSSDGIQAQMGTSILLAQEANYTMEK